MGDEQASFEARQYVSRQSGKRRRVGHHRVCDTGKRLNLDRNAALRIHQTLPLFDNFTVLGQYDADFGNAVACRGNIGGFQINDGELLQKHVQSVTRLTYFKNVPAAQHNCK